MAEQNTATDQPPVRRYGEQAMDSDAMPPQADALQRTEKHVNWGQVLKGVAIITGVALVAVVGWVVAAPLGISLLTYLSGLPIIGPAIGGLVAGAGWLVGSLQTIGTALWAGIVSLGGQAASATGAALTSAGINPLTTAEIAATGPGFGIAGAGLGLAAAAPLAVHSIGGLDLVSTTTVHPAVAGHGDVDGAIASHAAANATKIGQHAVERERPRPEFVHRVNASAAYQSTLAKGGSYADAVRAAHDRVASAANPRSSSFSQQLNADRVALENMLKDPTR